MSSIWEQWQTVAESNGISRQCFEERIWRRRPVWTPEEAATIPSGQRRDRTLRENVMGKYMVRNPYVEALMWNGTNIKDFKRNFIGLKNEIHIDKDDLVITLVDQMLRIPLTAFLIHTKGGSRKNRYSVMELSEFEKTYMRL